MSVGYGRGHYGSEQLARPRAGSGPGRGWFKIVAVAGLGAAIWWWVLPAVGPKSEHLEPHVEPPTQPPSPSDELGQIAHLRGFTSTKAYEDSMVAIARELRASGAKVELSPHLQHLMPRVEEP